MRILRARQTLHCIVVFVRCTCGRGFAHRASRPQVICLDCGRVGGLAELVERYREARQGGGSSQAA